MAEFCICGASRDHSRGHCYFSTDPTVDVVDFVAFFDTLSECVNTNVERDIDGTIRYTNTTPIANAPDLKQKISATLNYLANRNLIAMTVEDCERIHVLADNCRWWMGELIRTIPDYRLGFVPATYRDNYSHIANVVKRHINERIAPAGRMPELVLSSENS